MDCLTHKCVILVNIAAKDGHAAHAYGECEESLIHRAHDDTAIDF